MKTKVVGSRLQLAGHIERMCEESDKESMEDRRGWSKEKKKTKIKMEEYY